MYATVIVSQGMDNNNHGPLTIVTKKKKKKKKTIYCSVVQAANLINSMHATMKIITRLQLDYARIVCLSWIRFYDPPYPVPPFTSVAN